MRARAARPPEEAETFVSRRMSLRHLRVVQALADAGSLSAAAELLHVTQPAVSKTLGEIERALGQTLFMRRGRSMRATALGERMIALARKLEADLCRGAGDVASLVRGASGELLIGATNAALTEVLPDAMTAMKAEHPDVTLTVHTHALTDLFADLRKGRLDLVLARSEPQDMPPDLERHCLLSQHEVVVISSHHELAHNRRLSWETLNGQAWVWPLPGTRSRALRDRLWQRMGLPLPCNVVQTGDLMLTLSLMRRMPLLTILPHHVARAAAQSGAVRILPLQADLGMAELSLWHLREPQSELVEGFKRLLLACAERLDGAPQAASASA